MSFTRAPYDTCAYDKRLDESTSVLTWLLDPNKFYNCNECRIEFGIVGGNSVSRYSGNMVDLESDLRGQTRLYSQCPAKHYLPGTIVQGKKRFSKCKPGCGTTGLPCGSLSCRNEPLKHLPDCQMIQYKPRIDNVGYDLDYPPCPKYGVPKINKHKKRSKKAWSPHAWQGQMGVKQPSYNY